MPDKPFVLACISDLHCGHVMGLTPPVYQTVEDGQVQEALWNWYGCAIDEIGTVDALVVNGDAIEGEGKKETIAHITTDVGKQITMAATAIGQWEAKRVYMTYGTPYHVTGPMEYEKILADEVAEGRIATSWRLNVRGNSFSFRHHTGKTSIPHGQGALIAKRLLWEVAHGQRVDYCVRSHVHEYCYIDTPMGVGITTPALQVGDSVYGRKFDSWYSVGFVVFRVYGPGEVDTKKYILKFEKKDSEETIDDLQA